MEKELKLKLADHIMSFINDHNKTEDINIPIHVGWLNKKWRMNGFKVAEPGTVVYEFNGKYFINLESLDGKRNLEVSFYKETLAPSIDFIKSE